MTTVVVREQRQEDGNTFLSVWANEPLYAGAHVTDRYGREMEIVEVGEPRENDCVTVKVRLLSSDIRMTLEEYEVLHQAAVELYATGETDQHCPRCGARLTQFQDDGYECMVQCPCGMSYRHNILD